MNMASIFIPSTRWFPPFFKSLCMCDWHRVGLLVTIILSKLKEAGSVLGIDGVGPLLTTAKSVFIFCHLY